MSELKPFLEDMLSMSTGTDGRTLQIHFSRSVTKEDRQAIADAHNAIVRGQITPAPQAHLRGDLGITKEWFERRAKAEADLEIGAGFSVFNVTDADAAQMEVLAERALPEWARLELDRLRKIALDMQKGYIATRDLVERAQAIISTSTYPNWHADARAALATTEGSTDG